MTQLPTPVLSICMATFRRADFIGETLTSILEQIRDEVEIVVVDGASPDRTPQVVEPFAQRHPSLRYVRMESNGGVDRDYDHAVTLAHGRHCWLMTDDDVLVPGAIDRILDELRQDPALLIIDAEVRDATLTNVLQKSRIGLATDRTYRGDDPAMFAALGDGLSFIGSVVIRRELWLARKREPYFGSLFIHMGVIGQARLAGTVKALADPLIQIRYGNAMWTTRSFEIWMFLWPQLVWSMEAWPEASRAAIVRREPWRRPGQLLMMRAKGCFDPATYRRFFSTRRTGPLNRTLLIIIVHTPRIICWIICMMCFRGADRAGSLVNHVDLVHSPVNPFRKRA